jgi:pre-rRNA-processing protein IPI3
LFICSVAEKITSLCSTPDGLYCFGGSESGNVYVWQVCNGTLLKIFSAHIKSVTSMCCSEDSSYLITGGNDTLCYVWNIAQYVILLSQLLIEC